MPSGDECSLTQRSPVPTPPPPVEPGGGQRWGAEGDAGNARSKAFWREHCTPPHRGMPNDFACVARPRRGRLRACSTSRPEYRPTVRAYSVSPDPRHCRRSANITSPIAHVEGSPWHDQASSAPRALGACLVTTRDGFLMHSPRRRSDRCGACGPRDNGQRERVRRASGRQEDAASSPVAAPLRRLPSVSQGRVTICRLPGSAQPLRSSLAT